MHIKFAAASRPEEGKKFCAVGKNWLTFLILQDGTLRIILSNKEGQNLDLKNMNEKKSPKMSSNVQKAEAPKHICKKRKEK
jgi:hypothetical protein